MAQKRKSVDGFLDKIEIASNRIEHDEWHEEVDKLREDHASNQKKNKTTVTETLYDVFDADTHGLVFHEDQSTLFTTIRYHLIGKEVVLPKQKDYKEKYPKNLDSNYLQYLELMCSKIPCNPKCMKYKNEMTKKLKQIDDLMVEIEETEYLFYESIEECIIDFTQQPKQ